MIGLDNFLLWICTQFQNASTVVEYVSWITASIFAVLAVFTIFLAHQYETNTSQLFKISWEFKNAIKVEDKEKFKDLVQQFLYFSKNPTIVIETINSIKKVIYFLVCIWLLSCLSMISIYIVDSIGNFQIISYILIISSTFLFTYFSIKMLEIIDNLINKQNSNYFQINDAKEIMDLSHLDSKGFDVETIIRLINPKWTIQILSSDPHIRVYYSDEIGFSNYHVLLTFFGKDKKIILGSYIDSNKNMKELEITSEKPKLNIFFNEEKYKICDISMAIFVNNKTFTYKLKNIQSKESDYPKKVEFGIEGIEEWTPPQVEKDILIESGRVEKVRIKG